MNDNGQCREESTVKMTFTEHLEELRKRVMISVAILLGFALVFLFFFHQPLFNFVKYPFNKAVEIASRGGDVKIASHLQELYPVETFVAKLKICFLSAIFISAPFVFYQLWLFIGAGLYSREKRYVKIFMPVSVMLFIIGVTFGFLSLPYGLSYLIEWGGGDINHNWAVGQYVSFLLPLVIILGFVFQLPLVMLFFAKIGVVNHALFAQYRKYAVLVIVILSAVLTPPDFFTQILLATPMLILYEAGILLSRFFAAPKTDKDRA